MQTSTLAYWIMMLIEENHFVYSATAHEPIDPNDPSIGITYMYLVDDKLHLNMTDGSYLVIEVRRR